MSDVRFGSMMARGALLALLLGVAASGAPAVASPRFFASAVQCESASLLAPGGCRTAFANAMAEFTVKAPTYRSRRACFQRFGPCMPWPIGTRRFDAFRPQWVGVTVDADAVLPATAPGKIHLDFAPQSLAALSPDAAKGQAPRAADPATADVKIMTPAESGEEESAFPPARPGSGFTMIDGVLTYPAPARFQPKSLKHP